MRKVAAQKGVDLPEIYAVAMIFTRDLEDIDTFIEYCERNDLKAILGERLSDKGKEEVRGLLTNCALYGKNPKTGHTSYHWFMSNGYAIFPFDYNAEEENAEIIKEHPSFGMVRLSRRNSRGVNLFGSSITHNEIIAITIAKGEVEGIS